LNHVSTKRRLVVLAMLAGLLLAASGCAGGVRASSWTGLTVVGDTLYLADLQQARAMNATSGETLWTFPANPQEDNQGLFYATPAVSDAGQVFVASQLTTGGLLSRRENIVWALDAETGAEIWRFGGATGMYVEGGALGEGLFVIGNGDGNVYALDRESGSLQWTFETDHRVWSTPLIVSDTVYVGSMDRNLYALDLNSGEMKWAFERDGAFGATPALSDGTLYIGAFDDNVYAIDAETGEERWRFQGDDWFWGSPAVDQGMVYVVDVKGRVYALGAESGDERWHKFLVTDQNRPVPVRAGLTLDQDGSKLFVSAQSGALYALDTSDGFVNWSMPAEGRGLSEPVVSESLVYQTLILGTSRIRALQAEEGREAWVFPLPEEG
jgi:outer membrane protein assembly factor BamB